jgi:LPXTG-motif cell wall-anchored protein
MSVRRLIALAASLLVLAAPSAALAQGAGDDQYSDPFGSGQSGGGGGSSNATPTPTPAATSAPSTPAAPSSTPSSSTTPSAASAAATPVPVASSAAPVTTSSGQLPYTGADAGLLALAGALCIAGGVALRVRLRDQQ